MDTGKLRKFFDPHKRAEEKEKEKKKSSQPWWMDDDDEDGGRGKANRFKKETPTSSKFICDPIKSHESDVENM